MTFWRKNNKIQSFTLICVFYHGLTTSGKNNILWLLVTSVSGDNSSGVLEMMTCFVFCFLTL